MKNTLDKRKIIICLIMALFISATVLPAEVSAASFSTKAKVKKVKIVYADHDRVKLKWKKVPKSTRYEVYRAEKKKGKYKRVATVKKPYVVCKKLKPEKKYYFKIRAVKRHGGKKKYSKYSRVIKVTTAPKEVIQSGRAVGKVNTPTPFDDTAAKGYEQDGKESSQEPVTSGAMISGYAFNALIPKDAVSIVFTNVPAPESVNTLDVSESGDKSTVAWYSETDKIFYVSSQRKANVKAGSDISDMFAGTGVESVDFTCLDNTETAKMSNMFGDMAKLKSITTGRSFHLDIPGISMRDMGLKVLYGDDGAGGFIEYIDTAPNSAGTYYLSRPSKIQFDVGEEGDFSISVGYIIRSDGEDMGTLPTITVETEKEGYTPAWFDAEGNVVGEDTEVPIGGTTYTAGWKANSYSISYHANGGVGTMEKTHHVYDEESRLNEVSFTKKGYAFTGWNTEKDGSGSGYTEKEEVINLTSENDDEVVLYAQWEIVEYIIKYELDGGVVLNNPVKYTVESDAFTLNNPERTGYIFKGWTGSNGDIPAMTAAVTAGSIGDKTYTANWKPITYTVKYNANGGAGTMSSSTHAYDSAVTFNTNTFTKTGYEFKGWHTNPASAIVYENNYVHNFSSADGASVTLYAIWKPITYTVKYNANGGAGTMSSSTHAYDSAVTFNTNTFTKTGYEFKGWHTNPASAIVYENNYVHNFSNADGASVTLYAIWKPITYTLHYTDKYYSGVTDGTWDYSKSATYDKELELRANRFNNSELDAPFRGWKINGTIYKPGVSVKNLTSINGDVVEAVAVYDSNPDSNGNVLTEKGLAGVFYPSGTRQSSINNGTRHTLIGDELFLLWSGTNSYLCLTTQANGSNHQYQTIDNMFASEHVSKIELTTLESTNGGQYKKGMLINKLYLDHSKARLENNFEFIINGREISLVRPYENPYSATSGDVKINEIIVKSEAAKSFIEERFVDVRVRVKAGM